MTKNKMKIKGKRILKNGAEAGYVLQKDGSYKWRIVKGPKKGGMKSRRTNLIPNPSNHDHNDLTLEEIFRYFHFVIESKSKNLQIQKLIPILKSIRENVKFIAHSKDNQQLNQLCEKLFDSFFAIAKIVTDIVIIMINNKRRVYKKFGQFYNKSNEPKRIFNKVIFNLDKMESLMELLNLSFTSPKIPTTNEIVELIKRTKELIEYKESTKHKSKYTNINKQINSKLNEYLDGLKYNIPMSNKETKYAEKIFKYYHNKNNKANISKKAYNILIKVEGKKQKIKNNNRYTFSNKETQNKFNKFMGNYYQSKY